MHGGGTNDISTSSPSDGVCAHVCRERRRKGTNQVGQEVCGDGRIQERGPPGVHENGHAEAEEELCGMVCDFDRGLV